MKRSALLLLSILIMAIPSCKQKAPSAIDTIMTRASIRSFTGEPVCREQLETILKAGMAAPSAINIQPWRFVVLTERERIDAIFGEGRRGEMFRSAGAVIVVCGQTVALRKPFGKPDALEEEWENIFWHEDCSAAAENILLAAHALGLGAVWTAGYPAEDRYKPVAEALGLPKDVLPLCIIPIGVPAENPAPKDKWKPDNIHWEEW